MDKVLKLAIIVAVLSAGFGVFYHYVIYLPGNDDARVRAYEQCKAIAFRQYEVDWATMCESVAKSKNSAPDCTMPRVFAERINNDYRDAQQRCLAEAKLF